MNQLKRITDLFFFLYVISLATSMSGMELFSGLVFILVSIQLLISRPKDFRWELPPFALPMLVFSAIVALGIFLGDATSKDKWHDVGRLRFFLIYAALYYYLKHLAASHLPWIKTLAVVTTVVGIYGFCQHFYPLDLVRPEGKKIFMYAIQDEKLGPLVIGTFNHHLTFASVYLFYASLFLTLGIYPKTRSRRLVALGALLSLLCIWTESRAAWIAVPLAITLVVLPRGVRWALAAWAAVGSAVGLTILLQEGAWQRLYRTFYGEAGYTIAPRAQLWKIQWQIIREFPWLGIGWNNNERHCESYFLRLFPEQKERFCGHAHSNFLQVLATTGILGLAAFVWLWIAVFSRLVKHLLDFPKGSLDWSLSWAVFVAFVGFQIQGVTQWNFGDAEVLHNVIFFWAVAASLGRHKI